MTKNIQVLSTFTATVLALASLGCNPEPPAVSSPPVQNYSENTSSNYTSNDAPTTENYSDLTAETNENSFQDHVLGVLAMKVKRDVLKDIFPNRWQRFGANVIIFEITHREGSKHVYEHLPVYHEMACEIEYERHAELANSLINVRSELIQELSNNPDYSSYLREHISTQLDRMIADYQGHECESLIFEQLALAIDDIQNIN